MRLNSALGSDVGIYSVICVKKICGHAEMLHSLCMFETMHGCVFNFGNILVLIK